VGELVLAIKLGTPLTTPCTARHHPDLTLHEFMEATMSGTKLANERAPQTPSAATADLKLEVVVLALHMEGTPR
jgi:hypothetical protein